MNKYRQVQLVLFGILLANIAVAALKIIIGSLIGSASVMADGFHSISDGSSNIVGMIGIRLAAKPEDKSHPYGHYKIETVASLGIGLLLIAVAVKVLTQTVDKFQNPMAPQITTLSLIVLVFTLCVNVLVTYYEHRKGVALNSAFLLSDAAHTKSDIFVTIGVLITLIGIRLGLPPLIDPLCSLVVAGFIFHAAYEVIAENIYVLIDGRAMAAEPIEAAARSVEGVMEVHKICSWGTKNAVNVDLHVWVDPTMGIGEAHALAHQVERTIQAQLETVRRVYVHVEPARLVSDEVQATSH